MGHTAVIPGIGAMTLPTEAGSTVANAVAVEPDAGSVALFTNPQGVWNNYTGTWEQPAGRVWNGKYWSESKKKGFRKKSVKSSTYHESKKPGTKQKSRRERNESDDDTAAGPPPRRKLKAAARVVTAKDESSYQPTTTAGARSEKKCGPQSGVALTTASEEVQSAVAVSDAMVTTGSSVTTEMTKGCGAVELMVRRMNEDAAARDEDRASIFVATVRPAVTAVEYSGTKNLGTSNESGGNGQVHDDCNEKVMIEEGAAPGEAPSTVKTVKMVESVNAVGALKMTTVECDVVGVVKATTAPGFCDDDELESATTSCSCDTVTSMRYEPWLDCELVIILVNDVPNLHNEQRMLPDEGLDTKSSRRARREARKAGERQMKILAVVKRRSVDFMQEHGATIDFKKHKVRYRRDGHTVVIPFRTRDEGHGTGTAAVRMAYTTRLEGRTVTPVEVAVSVVDGERGIFAPGLYKGAVMLATTVTTAKDGYALVPAINASVESVKLPSKRELGTWIPLSDDMTVLEMKGQLRSERVHEWLDSLGDTTTPIGE
ncbi:hypothetical protein PHMEG_0009456 [Phytophthora megakarya]|uniref:Uncharacterized protein n=1 Tax=Phytophthora megakarya TaxID=4795 RepID=A0A225WGG2_9STRA|nr:hypothetical protein PHMEG_0009456 [Phytophthora megakarya]